MENSTISRRELLKGTGALIVGFSLFGPATRALAQAAGAGGAEPEASSLDSWLAVGQDGSVTVLTSKVELGTGTETALAQIVAEELDVPFSRIHMEAGDTSKTVDQAVTAGSRTIQRAGPQLRQAAAVARRELLRQASERLNAPVEQLTVSDGVIARKWEYRAKDLLWRSDRQQALQREAGCERNGLGHAAVARRTRQECEGLSSGGYAGAAHRPAREIHRGVQLRARCAPARHAAWARGAASGGEFETAERGRKLDEADRGRRQSGAAGKFRGRRSANRMGRDSGSPGAESDLVRSEHKPAGHSGGAVRLSEKYQERARSGRGQKGQSRSPLSRRPARNTKLPTTGPSSYTE